MLGSILGGAAALGQAFGKKKAQPAQQLSGFAALPPEVKDAYMNYLGQVRDMYSNGGMNTYSNRLMEQLGQEGYGDLSAYMNPYTQQVQNSVLSDIDRQGNQNRSRLLDILGGRNSLTAFSSTATGQQLGESDAATQRARADAIAGLQNQNFLQAIQGRQQGLANLQAASQIPYQNLSNYGALLGQIPNSSINIQGKPEQPNALGRFSGAASALLGNPYISGLFGGM